MEYKLLKAIHPGFDEWRIMYYRNYYQGSKRTPIVMKELKRVDQVDLIRFLECYSQIPLNTPISTNV